MLMNLLDMMVHAGWYVPTWAARRWIEWDNERTTEFHNRMAEQYKDDNWEYHYG